MIQKLFVRDKEFYKKLFLLAIPIVLQSMITIGVNMMDTVMLGKYGEVQLSGSSLANDYINIFQILCMGMGCGAAVLTAQFWGNNDTVSVKDTVAIMLKIVAVIALLFTISVAFFAPQIMAIYTPDADVIEKGIIYFYWSLPTFILTGLSMTMTQILRSVGLVNVPLRVSMCSFFVNIFFNWVFIFGKLGMPEMQIAGAALGTVITRFFEATLICGYAFVVDKRVGLRIHDIFRDSIIVRNKFAKYALPVIASDLLLGFGNTAVSIIVGHISTEFTAAYSIVGLIARLTTVFTAGLGMASATMTGNRIGEGKGEQAYHEAITMLTLAIIIGVVAGGITQLIGPFVIDLYEFKYETNCVAIEMLSAVSIMIVFQSMQSVITKGVLRGGGDTKFAMKIDAVFMWLISVPLGYYFGIILHLNAFVVFIALKADWMIKSIIGSVRIISKKWITNITE